MACVGALSSGISVVGVDHNETHGVSIRSNLALTYTSHQREQVEKELETSLSAGKIRIFHFSAGVAQLVEHFLAKEDVASSSLVTRFCPLVPHGLQRGRPPFRQAYR